MRCYQEIGLNPAGFALVQKLLEENTVQTGTRKIVETYNDGRVIEREEPIVECSVEEREGEFHDVWYGEGPTFMSYYVDGKLIYEEYEQDGHWSSGPMSFWALKDGDGNVIEETLWPQEKIDKS